MFRFRSRCFIPPAFQAVGFGRGLPYPLSALVIPAILPVVHQGLPVEIVVGRLDFCSGLPRAPNQPPQQRSAARAIAFCMDWSWSKHVQSHLANLSEAVMFHRGVSPVQCRVSAFLHAQPQVAQSRLERDCPDLRGRRCTVAAGPNVESAVCSKPAYPDEVL